MQDYKTKYLNKFSKPELDKILGAIDNARRNSASKTTSVMAIEKRLKEHGLTLGKLYSIAERFVKCDYDAPMFRTLMNEMQNATKQKKPEPETKQPREGSKAAVVLEMLKRPEGATVDQIRERVGWLSHTSRAFIATSKKYGVNITSERVRHIATTKRQSVYRAEDIV